MHSTADLRVPEEIFATFAADPTGVLDKVARTANDSESPLHGSVNRFLATIPQAVVAETCADAMFRGFHEGVQNPDRLARIWFAERFLIDQSALAVSFQACSPGDFTSAKIYESPVGGGQRLLVPFRRC
jgi:hypothetical protein